MRYRNPRWWILCTAAVLTSYAIFKRGVPPLRPRPPDKAAISLTTLELASRAIAQKLDAKQVSDLEAALRKNPEDTYTRRTLVMFYALSGDQVMGQRSTTNARRRHLLWLIEHDPESDLFFWLDPEYGQKFVDPDPAANEKANLLWIRQASHPNATQTVLAHAAWFPGPAEEPMAEKFIMREIAMNPRFALSREWALPELYFETVVGPDVSRSAAGGLSAQRRAVYKSYAAQVRRKLAVSTDAEILGAVADRLVGPGQVYYRDHKIGFDPTPIAKSYITRALQLDPASIAAHKANLSLRLIENRDAILYKPGFMVKSEEQHAAILRAPESQRFACLAQLALSQYEGSRRARDGAAGRQAFANAVAYADEAERIESKARNDPDYGTGVYNLETVRGLIEIAHGHRQAAVQHMVAAADAPPSEVLQYGMRSLSLELPSALLRAGERASVVQFLERFSKTVIYQRSYITESAALIRSGIRPEWYYP